MKILHIASLRNDPFTGVCVAAPEHIRNQGRRADVALLNVRDCRIDGIDHQFIYKGGSWKDGVSADYTNPDIVVFHEVYHVEFARIAKELVKDGIPYVIIPHGCLVGNAQRKKWWKKKLANSLVFHSLLNNCKALQCLSNNELINTNFNIPKFIGTNGVNIPNLYKKHFNEIKIQIVYIGRLEVIPKGLDLLFKAIKMLKKETDFLQYVDAFDLYGPNVKGRYAEVESLIFQNEINDIVTLHHELKGEEKQRRLLDADIFIQTSRNEGMPMGILEAMSLGLPCLITKGTSLGDIAEKYDAGWVADNTVASIAHTIKMAIKQRSLFYTKSTNARKLIEENFSWSNISEVTIKKYQSLIR